MAWVNFGFRFALWLFEMGSVMSQACYVAKAGLIPWSFCLLNTGISACTTTMPVFLHAPPLYQYFCMRHHYPCISACATTMPAFCMHHHYGSMHTFYYAYVLLLPWDKFQEKELLSCIVIEFPYSSKEMTQLSQRGCAFYNSTKVPGWPGLCSHQHLALSLVFKWSYSNGV